MSLPDEKSKQSAGSAATEAATPGSTTPASTTPGGTKVGVTPPTRSIKTGAGAAKGHFDPGTELGKYKIIKLLGSGGMGAVYEAVHTGIGKPVALKTLTGAQVDDERAQQRFLREAAAASRLNHPHVVDVTDFGTDSGASYLVMELLRGEDLAALLEKEKRLPLDRVADIMLAVCAGVFAAHEVGVIHRDLKPQNIFLARTPLGEVVPKVLDFGISKIVDDQIAASNLTGTGTVIGTTHYLSPEQVTARPLDPRSDQYTLGVILYECASGRRPHDGETLYLVMHSITQGKFTPLRDIVPELPTAFEAAVVRAMSPKIEDRFASVHALGRALLPFASLKRRLLWSDYFDRDGPPVQSGAQAAVAVAGAGTPESPPGKPTGTAGLAEPGSGPLPATRTRARPATPPPDPPPGPATEAPRRDYATTADVVMRAGPPWKKIVVVAAMLIAAVAATLALRGSEKPRPPATAASPVAPSTNTKPATAAPAPVPAPEKPAFAAPIPAPPAAAGPEPTGRDHKKNVGRSSRRASSKGKPAVAPILD